MTVNKKLIHLLFYCAFAFISPVPESQAQAVSEKWAVYEEAAKGIHLRYPKEWHVRIEDSEGAHMVFLSRELIQPPSGFFKTGITLYQIKDPEKNLSLDVADPDKAAEEFFNSLINQPRYKNTVLERKEITVQEEKAYYLEILSQQPGEYDMIAINLIRFHHNIVSEMVLETPKEDLPTFKKIFQEILDDKEFSF